MEVHHRKELDRPSDKQQLFYERPKSDEGFREEEDEVVFEAEVVVRPVVVLVEEEEVQGLDAEGLEGLLRPMVLRASMDDDQNKWSLVWSSSFFFRVHKI